MAMSETAEITAVAAEMSLDEANEVPILPIELVDAVFRVLADAAAQRTLARGMACCHAFYHTGKPSLWRDVTVDDSWNSGARKLVQGGDIAGTWSMIKRLTVEGGASTKTLRSLLTRCSRLERLEFTLEDMESQRKLLEGEFSRLTETHLENMKSHRKLFEEGFSCLSETCSEVSLFFLGPLNGPVSLPGSVTRFEASFLRENDAFDAVTDLLVEGIPNLAELSWNGPLALSFLARRIPDLDTKLVSARFTPWELREPLSLTLKNLREAYIDFSRDMESTSALRTLLASAPALRRVHVLRMRTAHFVAHSVNDGYPAPYGTETKIDEFVLVDSEIAGRVMESADRIRLLVERTFNRIQFEFNKGTVVDSGEKVFWLSLPCVTWIERDEDGKKAVLKMAR